MRARATSLVLLCMLALGCTGTIETSPWDMRDPDASDDPARPDSGTIGNIDASLQPGADASPGTPDAAPVGAPDAETSALTADEIDLFDALNAARVENGLAPVVVDMRLMCAARKHAIDVGGDGSCGHVGSDGSWPWDRAEACGFPQDDWTVNEIAAGPGFTSGEEAVWGWSNSPGHWAAIVHTEATSVGVGVYNTCYIALFDCCVAGG